MRSTSERKSWPKGVKLGRCLVRVHAVTQRQLGNATTVLATKVVRNGLVVLRRVSEGLGRKTYPSSVGLGEMSSDSDLCLQYLCQHLYMIKKKEYQAGL